MRAGRTREGRRRAKARQKQRRLLGSTPLLRAQDHGPPVLLEAAQVGELGTSGFWAESFIQANRDLLGRLQVRPEIHADQDEVRVALHPGALLGAMPLLAPSTRKVSAGLVVAPRFGWSSVGRVLTDVGFGVEPSLGGAPMVPGSAREVPPWVLAGPVVRRVAQLLRRLSREFEATTEVRTRPRGRVDWNDYIRRRIPAGAWDRFQCTFPDLSRDQWLISVLRWTLLRVRDDLARVADSLIARRMVTEIAAMLTELGPGAADRPFGDEVARRSSGALDPLLVAGLEAVAWVAEERGLGGARTLDGLPWVLASDALWEAWVCSFVRAVGQRVGARFLGPETTRRRLRWASRVSSLQSLEPDVGLHLGDRTIWVDAKYKFHLQQIHRYGWQGAAEPTREAHRADVHQALAYAALADTPAVDTVLAYPLPGEISHPVLGVAEIPARRGKLRLALLGLPFGWSGSTAKTESLASLEGFIRS